MPEIKNAVKMKFIGRQAGSITFLGKYRGGAQDPIDQFADVDPLDVERLLRTGMWARVEPETKAEAKAHAKADAAEAAAAGDDEEAATGSVAKSAKKPKA